MWHAGIVYYALLWNGNNGLQCTYFKNNCLQKHFYEQTFFEYHTENGTNSTTVIYWG